VPKIDILLSWAGRILLCGVGLALVWGYAFKRAWVHQTAAQLTIFVLFVLGIISFLWTPQLINRMDRPVLDGVTLTLAVAAIAFAAWQFRDSRKQEKKLSTLTTQMTEIADQMATRFAGFFPKNLQEINQVIGKAEDRVDVMSDYVAYGHYSAPDQFDAYHRKLLDMPDRHVKVRMLVYARDVAEQMHENQFISSELQQKEAWERLNRFCKRFESNLTTPMLEKIRACDDKINKRNATLMANQQPSAEESQTLQAALTDLKKDLDCLMFDRQLMYMKELLQRGIEIKQTREKMPFFMWCEDGHEAVFSFLHEKSKAEREVSFRTRDSRFVADSFEKKFEFLWEAAQKIELKDVGDHFEPDWLPVKETTT
jgi:hypothetical protein